MGGLTLTEQDRQDAEISLRLAMSDWAKTVKTFSPKELEETERKLVKAVNIAIGSMTNREDLEKTGLLCRYQLHILLSEKERQR